MKRKITFLITAALMLLTMMATTGTMWGQETVTATSSNLSANVSYQDLESGKLIEYRNSASNSYSNPIRIYANNTFTIHAKEGVARITEVAIVANNTSYASTTNNATWTATGTGTCSASSSVSGSNVTVTISGEATTITCKPSAQVRWNQLSVTYITSGSSSLTSTTVTIDASGLTNTDVYVNTEAGSLSATVKDDENNSIDGATVTWTSSATGIATIDADGEVTLVSAGKTTITASYAGNSTYSPSFSTYELTVTSSEPYNQPTNIEIIPNYTFWGKTGQFSGGTFSELSGSKDNVSLYWTKGEGSTYANLTAMRFYKDNTLVFTAPTGYEIKSIVITFTTAKDDLSFSPEGYSLSATTGTWAGSSATVTMSRPSNADSYAQISKFTVTIGSTSNLLTVTYDANGATSGSVPTDSNEYESGAEVTVFWNIGNLAKSGYVWAGWNTKADGTGTDHAEGSKFNISENTTLYAKWDAKTITNLAYTGTPTATQYAGQAFNPAGLTVTATFNDASQEDVTSQVVWTPNPLTIETISVTGTYMEYSVVVEGITVTYAPGTQDNPYTVAQARAAIDAGTGLTGVYATGIVSEIVTPYSSQYHNISYNISSDGLTTNDQLQAYRGKSYNGDNFTSEDDIQVGDIVVVYGNLKKYNDIYEFDANNQLVSLIRKVATPTFSPIAGDVAAGTEVTIACATNGATIYYTTDGTDPTTSSNVYSEPILVNAAITIKAFAWKDGSPSSDIVTAEYTIAAPVATPTFSVSEGTYNFAQSVEIECTTEGATIYYTTDGNDPTTESTEYTEAIVVNETMTIKAIGAKAGLANSEVASATYTMNIPVINASNVNLAYDATNGSIAYTLTNEVEGGVLTAVRTEGDWLTVGEVSAESVALTCTANEGEADRTATVTLTYNYETHTVTKVVTVTQAHFIVDYATLPFEFDGGYADIESIVGLTQEGIDSKDYSSSPKLKFNNTDDWLILKINERPGTLTFDIKGNTFSGGTFIVQTSEDGETYTDLATYSDFGTSGNDTKNEVFTNLGENVRYIKWIYTNKSSGNVGLGNIALAKYVAPEPAITLNSYSIEAPNAGASGTLDVTYHNITEVAAEVWFCNAEGTEDATYDWIIADINAQNNVEYLVYENDGEARTAYFKVYALDDEFNDVYSDLVTVTQSANVPKYTVNFTVGEGGTFVPNEDFTGAIVEIEAGTYNLPSATKAGFEFAGWNDGNATYEAGAEYTVSTDIDFTAQWTEVVGVTYELVVSTDDIVPDSYYLITSGTDGSVKAMAGQNTNNRAAVNVTVSNNVITNPENVVEFLISGSGTELNPYTIYDENYPGYLYAAGTSSANYLKTQAEINARAQWTITINNSRQTIITALTDETDRKIMRYNSVSDVFSCYGSGQQPIYLFKKVDNSPSISADNVDIAYNATSGSIIYEIDNYVAGEMAATTEADWISDFTYEPEDEIGEVGFTTTPNELYESRSATVTLTFTYGNPAATVTKDVTVTQNGQPSITVTPATANVAFAGSAPEFAVTYESLEIDDADDFDVEFYETSTSTTAGTQPTWITNVVITGNTTDGFTLTVTVAANDGAARDAYLKVYAAGSNDYIYSNLVTINQAAFVQLTTYSLVTSVDQIVSGKHYLFVGYKGEVAYAMGYDKGNNRNAVEVTVDNNTIPETVGAYEFVINNSGEDWTIYDNNVQELNTNDTYGFLYAAGGTSNNYLKTRTTNNDNKGIWTITIDDETHVASITAKSTGRNKMRFNDGNSPLFSCYSDGQKDIYLYVKDNDNNLEYYGTEITYSGNSIPDGGSITVGAGSVMTVPNNFENNDPNALVIEDGGQLIHTTDVEATVQKGVSGYTNKSGDGWYLISSPVDNYSTSTIATGTYDLFIYNEPNAYWYSNTGTGAPFNTLERAKGYLYANAANITLDFAGSMIGTETEISKTLSFEYDAYTDLKGFNLMGNPFSRNLGEGDMTVGGTAVTMYYGFDDAREEFETKTIASTPIKPGQGFFIQATEAGQQLVFNPATSEDASDFKYISISAGDENFTDKAYIQFGYGNTLRKMTFGENTMVYVMNNDDDYAAARVEELAGTMPVHFVPIEDGFYTITVETKNIENLNYMHLIDNIKNTEIDLLVEPSYTFKASESDNADRFYLVFDFNNYTGVNENYTNDNFAHQIGDEIFVNGEGTLQVFDMLGRFVAGYNVNGDKRISTDAFNTGVYIFRMVGTEVKTQKIVVR